jgi:anti-sigma-K factor RskA
MNTTDTYNPEWTGDEALALDYALGILVEPELSMARRRIDADARFARLVSRSRARLGTGSADHDMADDRIGVPSPETWQAILARISSEERA